MSLHTEDVIALGKKLVAELGLDQSGDTIGRWMAHRVADLISDAELSTGSERESKMAACSSAILDIWRHRQSLASGQRPFEDFEPIFRALQALDPEESKPIYYRQIRAAASGDEDLGKVGEWLKVADSLDGIARTLIRDCIVSAAASTDDDAREWVKLTRECLADADKDVLIINILNQATEETEAESLDDIQIRRKTETLERMEAFLVIATGYANSLREEIEQAKLKS